MKINVVMPQLGESVSEGEVIRWLKRAGDAVRRDEALVEVKTDKATVEIPAPSSGTLSEIVVPEGQTVQVGAGIAVIESTSEAAALSVEGASSTPRKIEPAVTRAPKAAAASPAAKPATSPASKPAAPAAEKPATPPVSKPAASAAEKPATPPVGKPATPAGIKPAPAPADKSATPPAGKPTILPAGKPAEPASKPPPRPPQGPRPQMTPLARRIASEFGLDPSQIQGTGEGGRITREDVLNATKAAANAAPAGAEPPEAAVAGEGAEEAAEKESPATAESAALPAEKPRDRRIRRSGRAARVRRASPPQVRRRSPLNRPRRPPAVKTRS